ncbi:hypothetical protein DEO72_LG4g2192 [Vigna unguiculata]|uniref:Secreted protein n=1 Tax=Vigna unguiculata TaxID=3917 RepID=A0A4D6LRM6_VIGUN|nr:hypothetical protein DEO72_LG4g2192 [Vigna unguiculata]
MFGLTLVLLTAAVLCGLVSKSRTNPFQSTMVSTGLRAQASRARLGEINRGSPKMLHASGRSNEPCCSCASEHLAHARRDSPKRDPAPRLAEGGSLRRVPLAWARPCSLSEARSTEARPRCFTRAVAQTNHVAPERASISPKREGSRLSEIPHELLFPFFEPSPRRRGLA